MNVEGPGSPVRPLSLGGNHDSYRVLGATNHWDNFHRSRRGHKADRRAPVGVHGPGCGAPDTDAHLAGHKLGQH